jgi:hypothetical protein
VGSTIGAGFQKSLVAYGHQPMGVHPWRCCHGGAEAGEMYRGLEYLCAHGILRITTRYIFKVFGCRFKV